MSDNEHYTEMNHLMVGQIKDVQLSSGVLTTALRWKGKQMQIYGRKGQNYAHFYTQLVTYKITESFQSILKHLKSKHAA